MASSPDKERELKQPLAVEQNNVLMSQTASLSTTNCFNNKKKRAKSRRIDLQTQQHHQDSKIELQSNDHHLIHVYNAIKLTNYYTNLLFNKQKQKCDKQKMLKTGTNWRTKQLAQQIPHQDIKLLTETANMTTSSVQTSCKDGSSSGQSCDEVKFIRNQRKLASQFKASLYYLNPMQSPKVNTSSSSSNWLKNTSSPSLLLRTIKETGQAKLNHHCFKVSSLTSFNFIHFLYSRRFEICLFNLR